MLKKIIIPLIAVCTPFILLAQQPGKLLCGNDILQEMLRTHHPDLANAMDQTFEAVRMPQTQTRGTLTINVVVHVVWKESDENLSDELIQSQIDILNADFNRLNADTANLRSIFQQAAGAADIEFKLAAIERVQTSNLFSVNLLGGTLIPEVKSNALGGNNAWDPEKYLNIWVCHIQPIMVGPIVLGQILGFAFPPAGLGNWPEGSNAPAIGEDGVVIDYRVFGKDNPFPVEVPGSTEPLIVKGRTPVHEVGHYLGLRHIWGDGGTFGPNDCAQSDGVNDTPFANSQSEFDCDITKNSCPGIDAHYGIDMPDLIENFMDYSSEDCMNMFTKGQVEIIRNVLTGPRSGLVEGSSSIHPMAAEADWQLVPNPTSGDSYVRLDVTSTRDRQVQLFDTHGRMVQTQVIPAGQTSALLPTHTLANGLYWVTCLDHQEVSRRLLVVQH
jgi:hypothetical protein